MNLRHALVSIATLLVVSVLCACNSTGACVIPSGESEICVQSKKSVCEDGRNHKYLGGDCPGAGYTKHNEKDDYWEK